MVLVIVFSAPRVISRMSWKMHCRVSRVRVVNIKTEQNRQIAKRVRQTPSAHEHLNQKVTASAMLVIRKLEEPVRCALWVNSNTMQKATAHVRTVTWAPFRTIQVRPHVNNAGRVHITLWWPKVQLKRVLLAQQAPSRYIQSFDLWMIVTRAPQAVTALLDLTHNQTVFVMHYTQDLMEGRVSFAKMCTVCQSHHIAR